MHQISFSEQSLSELDKLGKEHQLQVISQISDLATQSFKKNFSNLPKFNRDDKFYYRLKIDSLRAYIEKIDDSSVFCHYILPQHSLSDFLFRSKFPVSEEQMVEQHSSFWKYLESLKK